MRSGLIYPSTSGLNLRAIFTYRRAMQITTQRQLDIFAQIIACGDLLGCAREMALPVTTVEAELDALESRLGHRLFTREGRTLELTTAGRNAIEAMERLLTGQTSWEADPPPPPPPPHNPLARGSIPSAASPVVKSSSLAKADLGSTARQGSDGGVQPVKLGVPKWGQRNAEPEAPAPQPLEAPPSAEAAASPASEPIIRPPSAFRPLPSARDSAPDVDIQNIVLAAHPAIFAHFQDSLAAFEATSPDIGITLRLEGLNATDVPDLFESGLADIAYFYTLDEPEDFPSRYAWSERVSLFIGADHPLASDQGVVASDLMGVPFLSLEPDNAVQALCEAALARTGLVCPTPSLETEDLYEIITLLQQGKGYFATMGTVARDLMKMGRISRIAYAQGMPQVSVYQGVRPALAGNAAVEALAEFLFR